ncbi:hypothetical protein DYB25_001163 [Aphanomyces astaci]|nr:hypothetical protein DYB36_008463 [Aphanomyces astaci]RHY17849.1 hypothetical protein DYB25_001163 [Aphanomyces astaci]RHY46010.1 hypothetical protein DYB38_005691 [Aphanomyces astaci]RHY70540.1 hypothetical protein DYB30_000897 [Aphanomyces astaci]RHZ02707.1 hypothetical protein DYB31_009231 [Aphanomyces astaci]
MSELTAGNAEEEHYYGMSNQYQLSFFFSLFLALLMTSIVLMIFDPNTFFIALLPPIIFNSGPCRLLP